MMEALQEKTIASVSLFRRKLRKAVLPFEMPGLETDTDALLDLAKHFVRMLQRNADDGDVKAGLNTCLEQLLECTIDPFRGRQMVMMANDALRTADEPLIRQKAFRLVLHLLQKCPILRTDATIHTCVDLASATLLEAGRSPWEEVAALHLILKVEDVRGQTLVDGMIADSRLEADGFFLRAALLEEAKTFDELYDCLKPYLSDFLLDPADYVRIRSLEVLEKREERELLKSIATQMIQDNSQVCAAYAAALCEIFWDRPDEIAVFAPLWQKDDKYSLGFFLDRALEKVLEGLERNRAPSKDFVRAFSHALKGFMRQAGERLRRKGELLLAAMECAVEPASRDLYRRLSASNFLPRDLRSEAEADLAQVLVLLAHDNDGFELGLRKGHWTLRSAYRYRFSIWRLLHELRRPSSSKRQSHPHWLSRSLDGFIRIPSNITCELVETTVPGEPLFIAEAGGWRPWLPLLCDAYRLLNPFRPEEIRIHTAAGITHLQRPKGRRRLSAWLRLVWNYAEIARLRNWSARSEFEAAAYSQKLRDLGFQLRFQTHRPDWEDETVSRFF